MPELPEVETIRRYLRGFLLHQTFRDISIRTFSLRQPVPSQISTLVGQPIRDILRRGKYLIIVFDTDVLIIHFGMSGTLKKTHPAAPVQKHDHLLFRITDGVELRYEDPRRFGLFLMASLPWHTHQTLRDLGPEPLSQACNAKELWTRTRHSKRCIRDLLIDQKLIAGIGNIYANETLFRARIHPATQGLALDEYTWTVVLKSLRTVLHEAIQAGGSSIRDFVQVHGRPGYFQHQFMVYQREVQPCKRCGTPIIRESLHGRSIYFCSRCQPFI